MSDYLDAGLLDVQSRHPYLLEVRRKGLVMSVKFDHPNGAAHMMKTLYDNGVWTIYSPFEPRCCNGTQGCSSMPTIATRRSRGSSAPYARPNR